MGCRYFSAAASFRQWLGQESGGDEPVNAESAGVGFTDWRRYPRAARATRSRIPSTRRSSCGPPPSAASFLALKKRTYRPAAHASWFRSRSRTSGSGADPSHRVVRAVPRTASGPTDTWLAIACRGDTAPAHGSSRLSWASRTAGR